MNSCTARSVTITPEIAAKADALKADARAALERGRALDGAIESFERMRCDAYNEHSTKLRRAGEILGVYPSPY